MNYDISAHNPSIYLCRYSKDESENLDTTPYTHLICHDAEKHADAFEVIEAVKAFAGVAWRPLVESVVRLMDMSVKRLLDGKEVLVPDVLGSLYEVRRCLEHIVALEDSVYIMQRKGIETKNSNDPYV